MPSIHIYQEINMIRSNPNLYLATLSIFCATITPSNLFPKTQTELSYAQMSIVNGRKDSNYLQMLVSQTVDWQNNLKTVGWWIKAIKGNSKEIMRMCRDARHVNSFLGRSYYDYIAEKVNKFTILGDYNMVNSYVAEGRLFQAYCPSTY